MPLRAKASRSSCLDWLSRPLFNGANDAPIIPGSEHRLDVFWRQPGGAPLLVQLVLPCRKTSRPRQPSADEGHHIDKWDMVAKLIEARGVAVVPVSVVQSSPRIWHLNH